MARISTVASAVAVLCVAICLPMEPVESFSGGVGNLRRGVLSVDKNHLHGEKKPKLLLGRHSLSLGSAIDANSMVSESRKIQQEASLFDDSMENFVPATKSLSETVVFFARYVVQAYKHRLQSRSDKEKSSSLGSRRKAFVENCQRLNEQRKNLVMLAGWGAQIVIPSFTFLILGAFMTSVVPHYSAKCMQLVATIHPARKQVVEALLGLFVTSTLAAFFTGCRGSLFWLGGSRTNYNVRVKLHRKLLLQEAAFFDSNETGYLLSRLNNDVNKIGQVVSFHVNIVCRQTAQFLFGSVYLLHISRSLALWTFAGIGFVAWMSAVYGRFANYLATEVQDTFASATAVAETSLSMSETIRAFDGVKVESNRYEEAQGSALELEEVQACAYGAHKFASDTVQWAMYVMLMFACWNMGRAGGLAADKLTSFLFYADFVLDSSNEVGDQWAKIQGAIGASRSVFELITRVPAVRDPPKRKDASEISEHAVDAPVLENHVNVHTNGDSSDAVEKSLPVVEASNVTLTYDTMEVPALEEVDLSIHARDRVAIVGRSGSGKSSMLRAMLRFYDPTSGNIKLNGEKMTDLTRQQIAEQVAVVEQEPSLFPLSLVDNVLYGIDKDSVDETGEPCYSEKLRSMVADSLQLCGLPVSPGNSLGLELDTRVGEGGRTLSGGQRQRTAIARALIRNPDVLLLDEPTAALDSESEKLVIMALKQAMERAKSMVMVTHRLGVVRSLDVNRVIVMEKGKIVESGHPEELLLRQDSMYASLASEQGIKPIERSEGKSTTLHSPVNL